jgi:hypothetical protein
MKEAPTTDEHRLGWTTMLGSSLVLALLLNCSSKPEPTGSNLKSVNSQDIPGRLVIIGKLGIPLGTLTNVRGRWVPADQSKPSLLPDFEVYRVNDKPVEGPTKFGGDLVSPIAGVARLTPTVGDCWDIRCVETGAFVGHSNEVWEELGKSLGSGTIPMVPRGFVTKLEYVRVTHLK